MRDCGSLSHKSIDLSIKLVEIDTNIDSCSPIQSFVFVGFFCDVTQTAIKTKTALSFNNFVSILDTESCQLLQLMSLVLCKHISGNCF